ncbi:MULTISPECIES: 2-isopropylmalate synthase [Methanococcoides]|uniref:Probable 2-isopropylmalate synthase n=1 Tax=Methanococcoides seepicolus TaxID=2828780 RepID=A0A9E4ZIA9_9EURY|nr:2-isopropylmalate synthase [Methanococcoides sp.]MCM1987950.1 2-isopropylmalate synthase [Methanococcoides seepicolus]
MRNRKISIFDTTLRDGEQTPGVSLTPEQKIEIAHQLSKLGVDTIEAGFPIASAGDMESVRNIANAGLTSEVCGLARVLTKDLDTCIDAGVGMIHTFVSTSDIQRIHTIKKSREEVVEMSVNAVQYIKDHGMRCMFSAMDATRTDLDYLIEVYKAVEDAGCDIINVPDTVGIIAPSGMYRLISKLDKEMNIPIDTHCHNDFGLAVANSLMAIEAGASQAQVTVNGLGERAGNADLAETVMSLHSIYGAKTNINTEYIVETARMVERYTGVQIPPHMPIVGENAFAHESGIHTHGVLENSDTFEPGIMTPEMVGHTRRIVLGKHAGKHAVLRSLQSANINPTDAQLDAIIKKVKMLADKGKRITDADLYTIAFDILGRPEGMPPIDLKEVSVMTGNITTSTAVVKALFNGKECVASNVGVGPVDAALKAVETLIGQHAKVTIHDFRIEAVTGGSDALAEVVIGVQNDKGRIVTARAANVDIVLASVEALVTAINMLLKT